MYWKETGGVEKLFSLPSRTIPARGLFNNYHRRLISHFTPLEDFSSLGPADVLALENCQTEYDAVINNNKRGRKRKQDMLAFSNQVTENIVDASSHSLAVPEQVREEESAIHSRISLNMDAGQQDSLIASNEPPPVCQMSGLDVSANLAFPAGDNTLGNNTVVSYNQANESLPELPNVDSMEMLMPGDETLVNKSLTEKDLDVSDDAIRNADLASDWCDYDLPPSVEAPQVNINF